jgi:glycine cleavage system H protein
MKKYSDQHEWVKLDGGIAVVGISDYAQCQLGDVVFVDLPAVGKSLKQRQEVAVVESVKAASDVYAPISGEVIQVNEALRNQPDLINTAPETEGWFFKLKPTNLNEMNTLMDEASYKTFVE